MRQLEQQKLRVLFATNDAALLLITSICTPYTVLSAGFSVFVHWKVAVHRVHNLRPCTGFLFPVILRSIYRISFYLPMYCTFPVVIFAR